VPDAAGHGRARPSDPRPITRRELLGATVLAGAAAVARPARAAAPAPAWKDLVPAAKREAKVVVNTFPGDGYGRALKAFTQAYPEIKLEHTSMHSQDFAPRILQERKANLYTWDVVMIPTSTALQVLRPAGVWDPVRPVIVQPEAKDDAGWDGGFERGFSVVKDRELSYGFIANRGGGVTINTDLVKEDQLRSFKDLLDPRWKGKLLLPDVRVMGDTFWPMTAARLSMGDDVIKRLFVDQEPVLSRDTRQVADFMVRGRFPIAMGVNPVLLSQFRRQGLGGNLKLLRYPEIDTVNYSTTIWLVNKAPHPAAAAVFINWLLTREAQVHWAREVETNSRRVGVEPGNPEFVVPKGARFFQVDAEENLPEVIKTQDIAKAVIK
jgi:iron(III) transport system substrate-binding protein